MSTIAIEKNDGHSREMVDARIEVVAKECRNEISTPTMLYDTVISKHQNLIIIMEPSYPSQLRIECSDNLAHLSSMRFTSGPDVF